MYKVIGWGVPSIPILIWSILMHQSNPIHEELRSDDVISSMCWISDVGNWIVWLRRGPILFILAFNLLILLHIIKILICSQIRNGQDSNQLIKVRWTVSGRLHPMTFLKMLSGRQSNTDFISTTWYNLFTIPLQSRSVITPIDRS